MNIIKYITDMLENTDYKFWTISYKLHFGHVKIQEHCLYRDVFSTGILTYIKLDFCELFSYFYWSMNCMSWVYKLYNIILTFSETETILILEDF